MITFNCERAPTFFLNSLFILSSVSCVYKAHWAHSPSLLRHPRERRVKTHAGGDCDSDDHSVRQVLISCFVFSLHESWVSFDILQECVTFSYLLSCSQHVSLFIVTTCVCGYGMWYLKGTVQYDNSCKSLTQWIQAQGGTQQSQQRWK